MTMLAALALLALAVPAEGSSVAAQTVPETASEAFRFELLKHRDRVETDGNQVRTLEVRVRLGTAQGVAAFGQIGLAYVDGYGEVGFEDVTIEKADRRLVEVKNGIVEDVNPFGVSGTSLPADIRFRKMTIPGLEPGDTLAYRVVHRQKPLAPGRAFGEMKLGVVPGIVQTYELDLPRPSDIKVRLREGIGASWEEVSSPPDRLVRRLALEVKAPASGKVLTKEDRRLWTDPDVTFTSFRSWAEVALWWWDLSKERLKPDDGVVREASGLRGEAKAPRDVVAALHAFVVSRIRYVNVSFGLGRMQPRPAADVLRSRYGDCKDKHALLAALASSLGVDVRPVLINSVRSDLLDDVPGPQQFDHMISVARLGSAPSGWLWLDGTNPFGGPGYLLPQLRDKNALLIEADGSALLVRTPKEPPFLPRQEVTLKGTLDSEGTLRGRTTWSLRSDDEIQVRAAFSVIPQERRPSLIKEGMARDWEEVKVENIVVSDPLDMSSPFRVEFDAQKAISAQGTERGLRLPLPDFDVPVPADSVPPGEPAVTFPLRELSARAEIEIPEGQLARAPLSVSLDRPFGTFRSAYAVEGRTLRLERSLKLSQASLAEGDLASYEAFRKAIATDSGQEFAIEGPASASTASTAEGLRKEGLAALEMSDYVKAVELLQKASDADPKLKEVLGDLGRALQNLGRNEEAVAAFTRQIEVAPFHENAYAWRAYVLDRLGRGEEAEKDLLKQIEVAPFMAWSYETLAERRDRQQRLAEAADLYRRAASIEPKKAERWLDLGLVQARAGQPTEARQSLDKAMALDPADWMKVAAAGAYLSLGDLARAGELAEAALPPLRRRLARMSPEAFGEGDLYWTERLIEAWWFVGETAAAAGDLARAERYLDAAWRIGLSPRAGWALGEVREKQGRLADAVELWSMASYVPSASHQLPADRQARIEAASRKLPATGPPPPAIPPGAPRDLAAALSKSGLQVAAEARLREERTIRLTGPALANLAGEVLLLTDADGRVERVARAPKSSPTLEAQIAKLGPIHFAWPRPDDQPFKVVQRALLACSTTSGCALVLDLPGMPPLSFDEPGSIRIVSLDPKDGAKVVRGKRVRVTATVRFELKGDQGTVSLVVQDQAHKALIDGFPSREVTARSGEVTIEGAFTVPEDATRIEVFLPLMSGPGAATSTVAGAGYTVEPR